MYPKKRPFCASDGNVKHCPPGKRSMDELPTSVQLSMKPWPKKKTQRKQTEDQVALEPAPWPNVGVREKKSRSLSLGSSERKARRRGRRLKTLSIGKGPRGKNLSGNEVRIKRPLKIHIFCAKEKNQNELVAIVQRPPWKSRMCMHLNVKPSF